ncbi:major facilitator superfamily domain-containing protein [Phialemonium atrogriseum]|uniref:Major facilitator superfamily domain-containing protein n=1 Tax=Phialemonium atrogriseum TaxID=1093897 RepID=A0AAJ0C852_9PEZI|nr:major facilitator superfamily domain-containing protein [Phialemonium atrogriseum]KAK1771923.1 major facilitator superfamily domain-containing protein [Phialemonium atrogriseum]
MAENQLETVVTSTSTLSVGQASVAEATHSHICTLPSRLSRAQSRAGRDLEKEGAEPSSESEDPGTEDVRTITGFKWLLVLLALYSSAFLYGLDTTIAADVQGAVVETFGHVDQLAWMGAGFPMGSVAIILLVGSLYTSFNMKWIFVASVLLFEIGSAICGAAPNMQALIVGRVIAGAGGAGIYLGALHYVSSLTTREERGRYISAIGFFWGLGAVLGPVIGGAFSVSAATWRWAFYINLVVGGVTAPAYLFYLPSLHPIQGVSIRSRIANLDFVGFALNIGIWVSFTLAFTMAGGQWGWNDGRTIATIVVFVAILALYALQQYFTVFTTTESRSFPGHLLKSRTQILLYIATSANITSLFVVVYFIPIYFQFVHNDSALMAAVRLLPFVIIAVTVNLLAGHLLSKIQYYMPIYLISGAFIVLGGTLLTVFLDPSTPQGHIYGYTILIAVGTGLTVQISYAVGTLTAAAKDMGDVISMQNVSQIGSTVIALVIAGQIFQSEAVKNLQAALFGLGFSDAEIHGAVAGAQSELFEKLGGELREKAVLAICQAMQKSFILLIVSGAVLIVVGALMKRERLFGKVVVA